jgi:type I restriction enzyme S subunit
MSKNMVPLGEVVDFIGGGTPSRDVNHYWNGEIPWASVKDFKGPSIDSTLESITHEGLSASSSALIPAGHVIMPTRMALGKAAINSIDVAINQDLKALKPKARIDTRYLLHAILSRAKEIQSHGKGATVQGITIERLRAIKVPLLPLEEQRRIAAILDKAAQLTEACASLQAAHRRMGESLFIQAFGEPRTNPLDLPSARLGAIADCQLGKMLDKKRQSGCSKRPYLRNANVRWFEIDTSDVLFMDIGDHEIDRFGVSQGDLLVCEGGEPGRSAIWKGGNGVIGFQKALHRVRADRHKVLPEYLNWALWMFAQRGLLSDHITSATIAHLTREKLVNINILIPPIPVQERFARQLEALNALNQSAKSRNQILRSLNSSTFSTLLGWCAGK